MSIGLSRLPLVCAVVAQGLACLFAPSARAQGSAGDSLFAANKFDAARTAYASAVKANPKLPRPISASSAI